MTGFKPGVLSGQRVDRAKLIFASLFRANSVIKIGTLKIKVNIYFSLVQ